MSICLHYVLDEIVIVVKKPDVRFSDFPPTCDLLFKPVFPVGDFDVAFDLMAAPCIAKIGRKINKEAS